MQDLPWDIYFFGGFWYFFLDNFFGNLFIWTVKIIKKFFEKYFISMKIFQQKFGIWLAVYVTAVKNWIFFFVIWYLLENKPDPTIENEIPSPD